MSNKTTAQRNAKRLQRLAEDELGSRPKLTTCHNILREPHFRNVNTTTEEYIAAVFLVHRERLAQSAGIRDALRAAAQVSSDPQGPK